MNDPLQVGERHGLAHVRPAIRAARDADLPLWAAFALLDKESNGQNIYGHDAGGVFAHVDRKVVSSRNFLEFLVRVMNGEQSNGVGPCQITYAGPLEGGHRDGGYFRAMAERGLRPWIPSENMLFGFELLAGFRKQTGSWEAAGTRYNGAAEYGRDFRRLCNVWRERLGLPEDVR